MISVSLDYEKNYGDLRKLIKERGIEYPVLNYWKTGGNPGTFDYEIKFIPFALLIDPEGKIAVVFDGDSDPLEVIGQKLNGE